MATDKGIVHDKCNHFIRLFEARADVRSSGREDQLVLPHQPVDGGVVHLRDGHPTAARGRLPKRHQ